MARKKLENITENITEDMAVPAEDSQESQISIEEAFEQLENIAGALENPELSLEDAFSKYKEGMELLKYCNSSIEEVEKKVQAISKEGELYEF